MTLTSSFVVRQFTWKLYTFTLYIDDMEPWHLHELIWHVPWGYFFEDISSDELEEMNITLENISEDDLVI